MLCARRPFNSRMGLMKAVFFDLDGTLFNTLPDIRNAMNYALRAYDGEEATLADVRRYVGRGLYKALSKAAVEKHPKGIYDEDEFALMYRLMVSAYAKHPVVETVPYEGIPELIAALKGEGIALGVVSNKSDPLVQEIVDRLLPGAFGFVAGEQPGYPLKPDPTLLLHGIESVGSTVGETVYVGDSEVDARTGENAGVRTVIVSYGFRSRLDLEAAGIESEASDVEELGKVLKSLIQCDRMV